MAIKTYGSVNGQSKEFKGLYGSVNGLSKEIVKLYASVNGISKLIYQKSGARILLSHKAASSSDWTTATYSDWNSVKTALNSLKTSYGSTSFDIKIEEDSFGKYVDNIINRSYHIYTNRQCPSCANLLSKGKSCIKCPKYHHLIKSGKN